MGLANGVVKPATHGASGMMDLTYPLRVDLIIQLQLPKDITVTEANRLSAFIRSIPFKREEKP
jgi:hypothetical protein